MKGGWHRLVNPALGKMFLALAIVITIMLLSVGVSDKIYSVKREFNLLDGTTRTRFCLIGHQCGKTSAKPTILTRYLNREENGNTPAWVVVSEKSFMFPSGVFGDRRDSNGRFNTVLSDIERFTLLWSKNVTDAQKSRQAHEYIMLLRRNEVAAAHQYAFDAQ